MDWSSYIQPVVLALIIVSSAIAINFNPKTPKSRRVLASTASVIALLILGSDVYIKTTQASSSSVQLSPSATIINDQNKVHIKSKIRSDLIQLLEPLRNQFDQSYPSDYQNFIDFKQSGWLEKSAAKTEYYIYLASNNSSAIEADPDLYSLVKAFGDINLLATAMEQTLVDRGDVENVQIMIMQIEDLL